MNKNLVNDVRDVFKELDPADLLAGGAPDDEYDSEVSIISIKLREGMSEDLFKNFIGEYIRERFDMDLPQEKIDTLVRKLLEIQL